MLIDYIYIYLELFVMSLQEVNGVLVDYDFSGKLVYLAMIYYIYR